MERAPALVSRFWQRVQDRDWDGAHELLSPHFVCEWPRSGERFQGADAFIEMNRAHPAPNWQLRVKTVVGDEKAAAAEVVVTTDVGVDFCTGFYTVESGAIVTATEYWTEQSISDAPEWRQQWSQPISP